MDDTNDMRNMILSDLIDKMHSRMADKMFPADPNSMDQPAVTGASPTALADDKAIDADGDVEGPMVDTEMTDEELDELMKQGS